MTVRVAGGFEEREHPHQRGRQTESGQIVPLFG